MAYNIPVFDVCEAVAHLLTECGDDCAPGAAYLERRGYSVDETGALPDAN